MRKGHVGLGRCPWIKLRVVIRCKYVLEIVCGVSFVGPRSAGSSPGSGVKSRARVVRNFVQRWAPRDGLWTGLGTAFVLHSLVMHEYCLGNTVLLHWYYIGTTWVLHWYWVGIALICMALALHCDRTGTILVLHQYCTDATLVLRWHEAGNALAWHWHCIGTALVPHWHSACVTALVPHWHFACFTALVAISALC